MVVLFFLFFFFLFPLPAGAQDGGFEQWREAFAAQALKEGISFPTVQAIVPELSLDDEVIELDRKQPEKTDSFESYVRRTVTPRRIRKGAELMAEYKDFLRDLDSLYGVPAAVVVALWGIESDYGDNMGWHDVFTSLATLAYEGRRADFFRGELLEALRIVDEKEATPETLIGSWAGALGQCQFMPSTYRRYAADGDGDGVRDIWENEKDVLASIAAYLAAEGWRAGEPWGRPVQLKGKRAFAHAGLEKAQTIGAWRQQGVGIEGKKGEAEEARDASLLLPDGPGGRAFLVYDNFRALLRWNRSTFFAASVGLLADSLERTGEF